MSENLFDKIIAQSKLSNKETEKQQRIVECAITLFSEKGYSNTSTSDIAKAAGVAEATIFRHYGTKQNLLLSIILPFLKEMLPTLAEDFINELGHSFECINDFLRTLIFNRYKFIKCNKEIFQIVVKELLYDERLAKELIPHFGQQVFDYYNNILDEFKARGEIINAPNSTILKLLLSSIIGYFTMTFILMEGADDIHNTDEIDSLVEFVSKGIKKQ